MATTDTTADKSPRKRKPRTKDGDPPMPPAHEEMVTTRELTEFVELGELTPADSAALQTEMREAMQRTRPIVDDGYVDVTVKISQHVAARILSYRCALDECTTLTEAQLDRVLVEHVTEIANQQPALSVEPWYVRMQELNIVKPR